MYIFIDMTNKYILYQGIYEDKIPKYLKSLILFKFTERIYYDNPKFHSIHNSYWEDDEIKIVFNYDELDKFSNFYVKSLDLSKLIRRIIKNRNIETEYGYNFKSLKNNDIDNLIVSLCDSYISDHYGIIRNMNNEVSDNVKFPTVRYPISKYSGLVTNIRLPTIINIISSYSKSFKLIETTKKNINKLSIMIFKLDTKIM